MPEQELHPPNVNAISNHVDGKTMPKRMGVNINANHLPISLYYGAHLTPFDAKDGPILRGYFA